MIKDNPVKRKLRAGGVAIGTMVMQVRSPTIAPMLKAADFDFIFLDTEHGSLSTESVTDIILAARGVDLPVIVRVPRLEPQVLGHPLDLGACGVLCPHTETVEDVKLIIEATKYYPLGQRGMSLRNVHTGFVRGKGEEVTKRLNEETMVVLQVETARGVENIEAMVAIEGVDAVYIGPNDLSQTLGVPGQIHHPEVAKRIDRVIEACNRRGVAPGLHTYDPESAKSWIKRGIRLVGYAGDVAFIVDAGGRATAELKGFVEQQR